VAIRNVAPAAIVPKIGS